MSYISRENAYRSGAAVGLTGMIALAFGRSAVRIALPFFGLGAAPSVAEIHQQLISDPATGAVMQTASEKFPTEVGRIEQQAQSSLRTWEDPKAVAQSMQVQIRDLYKRHLPDLAQAPSSNLAELTTARLDLINDLHEESPALCAALGAGNISLDDLPAGHSRELLVALSKIEWRAMAAGRDAPTGRHVGPLEPADGKALVAAMRTDGMSELEMQTFARNQIGDANVDIACGVVYHVFRAISTLPSDQRDRVIAAMTVGSTS